MDVHSNMLVQHFPVRMSLLVLVFKLKGFTRKSGKALYSPKVEAETPKLDHRGPHKKSPRPAEGQAFSKIASEVARW